MKAGFGRYDITPRVGVELYGFGPYRNRKSTGIRDIIEARAAAFEVNGQTAVMIGCDLCMILAQTVDKARELIRERHPELAASDIMVCASHTHSGPATTPDNSSWGFTDLPWFAMLPYRIAEAASAALDNMEEATVSQALVPCRHMGLNRVYDVDAPPLADVLKDDWEPARPELTDTECRVIRIDAVQSGKMLGFLAYFGCHPVVCSASSHLLHGDYPGIAIHNLMREFPGTVGLFLQGAEGDVNSGCVHKGEQESLLALDVFAARFANAVRKGLQEARPVTVNALRSISRKYPFSTKQVFTYDKLDAIRREQEAILLRPDGDDTRFEFRMAAVYLQGVEAMKRILDSGDVTRIAELQIIRLGEFEFMGAPFEIMQAIKNDMHKASNARFPMLMSLANGSMGYAPDNKTLKGEDNIVGEQGNYEAIKVPLIFGQLPYADIHNELLKYMIELEGELTGK